jgi:hypothetical protein
VSTTIRVGNIVLGNHSRGRFGIDWKATVRSAAAHLAEIDPTISPLVKVGTLCGASATRPNRESHRHQTKYPHL